MVRPAACLVSVENDPGCVKTLGGITAPGILGSTVMRRAKKRKNLSSARHCDQIRFCFHTTKTQSRPEGLSSAVTRGTAMALSPTYIQVGAETAMANFITRDKTSI